MKQAIELQRQAMKPVASDTFIPHLVSKYGVRKTFAIYPHSGKMKTRPAYLPIHEDAKLPCII